MSTIYHFQKYVLAPWFHLGNYFNVFTFLVSLFNFVLVRCFTSDVCACVASFSQCPLGLYVLTFASGCSMCERVLFHVFPSYYLSPEK